MKFNKLVKIELLLDTELANESLHIIIDKLAESIIKSDSLDIDDGLVSHVTVEDYNPNS